MRIFIFLILCFISLNSCSHEVDDYESDLDSSSLTKVDNWKLIWEDNFNNSIDTRYWSKIPRTSATVPWVRFMSDNENCFEIKDTSLILKAIENNFLANDTASYLTGGIWTKGKKTIQYGKIEIRARFSKTKGAWPAIWVLPNNTRKWPQGGEIDIVETVNHSDDITHSVHTPFTVYNPSVSKDYNQKIIHIKDKTEYNVYGVIINEDKLLFTVNNGISFIYSKSIPEIEDQFPFSDQKFLLIDMQLGGMAGEIISNELPATMEIDWVRFYEKKDKSLPDY